MQIHRLDPRVVDQIAAGEVLERPANLVKELIENSLDAGATEIELNISNGGRSLMISDNGHGMAAEDLPLAAERHATSKIKNSDDLWKLGTYGFRGEALASAAAVSRLTIVSRTQKQRQAARMDVTFSQSGEVVPASRDVGTTIEIQDLFENVPARMKFLKSDSAEVSQIKRVLKAVAMIHPETSFKLSIGGELVIFWPIDGTLQQRVERVLDIKPLYKSHQSSSSGSVEIYSSSPNEVQKTSQNIWIFVNGRWILDRGIQSAVMESYRNLLMHGEWPTAVVMLDVLPDQVDVNVHPTKSQVKFADSREAFRLVHGTLRRHLETAPWLANVLKTDERVLEIVPEQAQATTMSLMDLGGYQFQQKQLLHYQTEPSSSRSVSLVTDTNVLAPKTEAKWSHLQVIGQIALTYVVAQSGRGVMYIDQHAAHERVAFERLMRSWRDNKPEVQNFLMPLALTMESHIVEMLLSQADNLQRMGVSIERGGPDMLYVLSSPSIVKEGALAHVLDNMGRDMMDLGESFSFERKISDIFATMACHSVVRAGQALSADEMMSLLEQMDEFPLSSFCPHGRPVFVEKTFRELDEEFGRIV